MKLSRLEREGERGLDNFNWVIKGSYLNSSLIIPATLGPGLPEICP